MSISESKAMLVISLHYFTLYRSLSGVSCNSVRFNRGVRHPQDDRRGLSRRERARGLGERAGGGQKERPPENREGEGC